MSGTKIINVLKDDTFKDILDIFRSTDAEDVVFVLPKRSAVFKREDHFAAFAAEAKRASRHISLMCANPAVNDWARKYGFTVIQKGVARAKLAVSDDDEEVRDPNTDAYDPDGLGTSDETTGIISPEKDDEMAGMHEEDEEAEPKPKDEEEETDVENEDLDQVLKKYGPMDMDLYDEEGNLIFAKGTPVTANLAVARSLDGVRSGKGTPLGVKAARERPVSVDVDIAPAAGEELDYIDAVWRDTARPEQQSMPKEKRTRSWSTRSAGSARNRSLTIGIVVAAVLAGGAYFIITMGTADIKVVPVSRDLEFELSIQSSDAFSEVDPLFNKIPGQLFQVQKTVEREFQATGKQEVAAKSRGTITVSSRMSDAQTLVATTRFDDGAGHMFRTLRTVTVPGGGQASVEVIADKPGTEYNITATAFTVPAFKEQGLGERYEKITGRSDKAFAGGAMGLSGIVTQDDLDNAVAKVTEELQAQVQEAFSAQSADLELINAAQVDITGLEPSVQVDQAADTFTVKATGTLSTVGFRAADLFVLLKDHAERNWQVTVLQDQLELSYDDIKFVADRGILAFSVTVLGKGYIHVDPDAIIGNIRGKGRDEVRDYFRSAENVRSSTIVLSPIWVRSVPQDASRIKLELLYEATPEP